MECQHCFTSFKNLSNLKVHLKSSKKCLKLRGLSIDSTYECICKNIFTTKVNLIVHQESCKEYSILQATEELMTKLNLNEAIIKELSEKNEKNEKLIVEQQQKIATDYNEYIKLQVRYEDLEKQHEKTISKLELKIAQCDSFIQTLAREGSNKVTTTNNISVRNQLSSTFTLDNLEPKKIEETMREHYTERDFFGGQKRLANFFMEKVIKTPDDKMLICCTDTSRKKFKILDLRGNLKEDIEARTLCDKLKVPTQMVTKEIYDTVIDKIDRERERLSLDDRSRREKLIDDSMRAQRFYMDILNFDDLNYNQDFMHELCVLLNV